MPHPPDGEKHRDTVRASFDKQAVEFAASPVMTDAAALARLVTWARVAGAERVLDVACGPGLVAAAFAPHVASVIGVDLTPAMLARGTAIVNERGIANVAFALADVERLAFPDGRFDRVVSRRAFHHFPDPARVLAETARVCRPGGAVVIEDQAPPADPLAAEAMTTIDRLRDPSHTRAVAPGAWEALCAASGLELERVWQSSLELDFDEWITRAHPEPADGARAREMLESAARGEIPGLDAWHVGGALRFTVGLQLVRAWRK